jgi:glycerol-3-phosphate acyltransferase PlsX
VVVKSHGGASAIAFQSAIEHAMLQVEHNVVQLVRDQLNEFINQGLLL